MEKCPGFGLVFFGEANYSREVNISPGIPDKTIPRGGVGLCRGPPTCEDHFPAPKFPGECRGGDGDGEFRGPRCTYALYVIIKAFLPVPMV